MPINTNAEVSYDVTTIREDLQEAYISISPTECPFQAAIGRKNVSNTYFEWPVVELAAVDSSNRVLEAEPAPGNDAATLGVRLGNYTQISDKVVEVSHTNEAVNGASDLQKMAKQISFKLKELKRDMETMLLANVAANAGAAATARQTAGMLAFLKSNTDRGATATEPTLSGGTSGYPNAAAGNGTDRALTEAMVKTIIASAWDEGATPGMVLVKSAGKQKISTTFIGIATRYKDAADKKAVAAIDVYVSDFGELQIVPTRFFSSNDVLVLDPEYARVAFLETVKQKPLAETGHAKRRLIWAEYGLQVDNEKAHGVIADIDFSL